MEGRHVPGPQGSFEDHPGDAVELHEHDAGHIRDGGGTGSPPRPAGRALVEPGVVVESEQ